MYNRIARMPESSPPPLPRRCSDRFLGRPDSVPAARGWRRERMAAAGVPAEPQRDDALLLLSELATNVLAHTASAAFGVRVLFFPGRLRVEVREEDRRPFNPVITAPDPDAEHGRGLLLVNGLAQRWGRFDSAHGPGMFFELEWDAAAEN